MVEGAFPQEGLLSSLAETFFFPPGLLFFSPGEMLFLKEWGQGSVGFFQKASFFWGSVTLSASPSWISPARLWQIIFFWQLLYGFFFFPPDFRSRRRSFFLSSLFFPSIQHLFSEAGFSKETSQRECSLYSCTSSRFCF